MYQFSADERPLDDAIDIDLPVEELERLARVDALLRLAAAYDRNDAIGLNGRPAAACSRLVPGSVRRDPQSVYERQTWMPVSSPRSTRTGQAGTVS
jgi:hypothetical protein